MNNGKVNNNNKTNNNYVWPVRSDNNSPRLFSFENLYKRYIDCRKNKRNTINALRFEINYEENLLDLQKKLVKRTYYPSRSVCFMATKPKLREIFAADFKDRIVHHILVDYLEKIWEPGFIYDSYACRKNKGIHLAVERLQIFLRKITANGTKKAFYLQLDIENFFMSLNKQILFEIISKKVKDEQILWLAKTLIFHDCTENHLLKGDKNYKKKIPPHKTLFNSGKLRGLPIGNLTSQFFANVYLNEFDQFVKHVLKCRYYMRYCDDFILLSCDQKTLMSWKGEIKKFLSQRLKLSLNKKRAYFQPVSNGINFLGYIVRKDYTLVRQRVVNNFKSKLLDYEKKLIRNNIGSYVKILYDLQILDELRKILASYSGHLKWANSYTLTKNIFDKFNFLQNYFIIFNKKIIPKYKIYKGISNLKLQYMVIKTMFPDDVILFPVGSFYEFFHDSSDIAVLLGLNKMVKRSSQSPSYGFPVRLKEKFIKKLKFLQRSITVVKQTDKYFVGIRERIPDYRLLRQYPVQTSWEYDRAFLLAM